MYSVTVLRRSEKVSASFIHSTIPASFLAACREELSAVDRPFRLFSSRALMSPFTPCTSFNTFAYTVVELFA